MNVLQRRMFAEGDSVTSLSPSILEYANKLGIDPTGKNAAELTDEIELTLKAQDDENKPGLIGGKGSLLFDYTDPLDYGITALGLTGIGTGAAAALKSANVARKLKKLADASKKLNPIAGRKKGGVNVRGKPGFQPRNPLNPSSYNYKPAQTAIYGTGAIAGAELIDDDSAPQPSIMPDEISAGLAELSASEQAQADRQKQADAKKSADQRAKDEKNKINETLKILQTRGREFDQAEAERISQERRNNAFTLMQEIGGAMASTGSIDEGLALGSNIASKRISEERLAKELAEDELKKKLAEEDKLSDKTWGDVTERYKEASRSLGKQKNLERIITEMEQSVSTGDVTGARGAIARLFDDIAGFTGFGDNFISKATEAAEQEKYVEAQVIQEILQESGRTISDRDRELIKQLIANLEDVFTGSAKALKSLSRVRLNIRDSMETSQSEIDTINSKYRERIPELSNYDRIYSISKDKSQGYVEEDDAVLGADEIGVD
tara:strand:+ start:591 stop:2072 length:1482 start_codon:yes stop_codon:yes gene_type:complete